MDRRQPRHPRPPGHLHRGRQCVALRRGLTLINVCDLAIASTDASIGCPEMGFATYPGMAGAAAQLSGITRKRAAWMILTTNRIDGATAERWGMVKACVEPAELLPRFHALAAHVAHVAQFDGTALAESKNALDRIPNFITSWRDAMDHGQMVNQTIRAKTTAQDAGKARFAAGGGKTPGRGFDPMAAPLAGRTILDLGAVCAQSPHALAVSMAAKLCAGYGAYVVRLIPATGDPLAAAPPLLPGGGSALDAFLNHGKHRQAAAGLCDVAIGDSAAHAGNTGRAASCSPAACRPCRSSGDGQRIPPDAAHAA